MEEGNRDYLTSLRKEEVQAKLLRDVLEAGTSDWKDALISMQRQCVEAIAENAASNMKVAADSLALLGRLERFEENIKQSKRAVTCLRAQTLDTMCLRLVNQNCLLIHIIQSGLDYAELEIRRATRRSKHLEGQEKLNYALLHQHLTEAKEALKEAVTLGDAAEAAAQVRSRLVALQGFLFALKGLAPIRSVD